MQISEIASELKLPYIKDNHKTLIEEATHTGMDYSFYIISIVFNILSRRGIASYNLSAVP